MYLDKETLFSLKQSVGATATSTEVLDLGPGGYGQGTPPYLTVNLDGFGGAGTLTVGVEAADDAAFTTGKRVIATYPVDNAALKAGGEAVRAGLPYGAWRYVRLQYTVGGTITAGMITAGLTL